MKTTILLGTVTMLLFAFTGCSKDNDNDETIYPNVVRISNTGFSPATIEMQLMSTVTWVNDDNGVHTVTADDAGFDSPDITSGKIYTLRFENLDTVPYHCKYHPAEKGIVIVNPTR